MTWRRGRKLGRTIYVQHGVVETDADTLIGIMDSADDAQLVVAARNAIERLAVELYERFPHDAGWVREEPSSVVDVVETLLDELSRRRDKRSWWRRLYESSQFKWWFGR